MNTINTLDISHPRKIIVPPAVGLNWKADGSAYEIKMDGKFSTMPVEDCILCGETMPGGEFVAWDCVQFAGEDIRLEPYTARVMCRATLCTMFGIQEVESSWDGAELLQRVLAAGGEGVCRKLPDSNYYATMTACKRVGTWHCRIVALDLARGSATVVDAKSGENRGRVPMGYKSLECRVNSIIKIEGLELTKAGKIRSPRLCKDSPTSWLISH